MLTPTPPPNLKSARYFGKPRVPFQVTKVLLTAGVPIDTYGPTQGYTALQQRGPFQYYFTLVNASNICFLY